MHCTYPPPVAPLVARHLNQLCEVASRAERIGLATTPLENPISVAKYLPVYDPQLEGPNLMFADTITGPSVTPFLSHPQYSLVPAFYGSEIRECPVVHDCHDIEDSQTDVICGSFSGFPLQENALLTPVQVPYEFDNQQHVEPAQLLGVDDQSEDFSRSGPLPCQEGISRHPEGKPKIRYKGKKKKKKQTKIRTKKLPEKESKACAALMVAKSGSNKLEPIECRWEGCNVTMVATEAGVKDHIRVHKTPGGKDILYSCKWGDCTSLLRWESTIRHVVTLHTTVTEKECTKCQKTFSRTDAMSRHAKTCHE